MKFTDLGGVRIVTRLVQPKGKGPLLQFDVIDTGIGIAAAAIGRLFQPFTQVNASPSRKYEGTGLGLAISRQLARVLGGDVTVSSELGKGSTFTATVATGPLEGVRLVEYVREGQPADAQADESSAPFRQRLDCRFILAEDIPDNQRLIASILHDAGATVDIADDGLEAVEKAMAAHREWHKRSADPAGPFDVILMDMQMPLLDGYEATRRLRHEGYARPIVALTANAMCGDREKCIGSGCDDFVSKPVDRRETRGNGGQWAAARATQSHGKWRIETKT